MSERIEAQCEYCLKRNKRAERMIESLMRDNKRKDEHYEAFKQVARMEMQRRKSFWEWLFS